LDIASSGILGIKGNISNTRKITIEGNLSNDGVSANTISGAGSIGLAGGRCRCTSLKTSCSATSKVPLPELTATGSG